jgi:catechol 2,3-dioxygenase-like lactoylglutathione lyase family enzyme
VGIKLGGFDFLYMPSRDVEADLDFYTGVLGGEAVWAIERFGTRVARVGLSEGGPQLILAQSLDDAIAGLQNEGVPVSGRFGFPYGEAVEFTAPGGQRLAVYELTRPEVEEKLVGRFDFWRS